MMQHLHIGGPRGFGAGVTGGVREVSAQQLVALRKSLWTWESCPVICEMMVTLSRLSWQVAWGHGGPRGTAHVWEQGAAQSTGSEEVPPERSLKNRGSEGRKEEEEEGI